jgi:hypothetical protein
MENQAQTEGVKEVAASPAPQTVAKVEAPAESKPVTKAPEQNIPKARFDEVNNKMKAYKEELARYKSQPVQAEPQTQTTPTETNYAARLQSQGIDPKASEILANVVQDIVKEQTASQFASEQRNMKEREALDRQNFEKAVQEVSAWTNEFIQATPDYTEYEPVMDQVWSGLSKEMKISLSKDSNGMKYLYELAKGRNVNAAYAKGEEEGRTAAYETAGLKNALSSTPAKATPDEEVSLEKVKNMSLAEYKKDREKILKKAGFKK